MLFVEVTVLLFLHAGNCFDRIKDNRVCIGMTAAIIAAIVIIIVIVLAVVLSSVL